MINVEEKSLSLFWGGDTKSKIGMIIVKERNLVELKILMIRWDR